MDCANLKELEVAGAEYPAEDYDEPGPVALEADAGFEEDESNEIEAEHFDDALKLYMRAIQKTSLLTAEKEKALAGRIAQGDRAARDEMIESNLRLVVKMAKRYMFRGLPFIDLIEEGNIGLIKAVDRFQADKECRFSTYATWWIRQSIERALTNQSRTVRVPVHVADDIHRMLKTGNNLGMLMNREPTVKEIAAEMDASPDHVNRLMIFIRKTCSLEQSMGANADYHLSDTVEDTSTVSPAELSENVDSYQKIKECLDTLPDNERTILKLRFGLDDKEPQTLDSIGRRYGVTRERIRQIETKALLKLRVMTGWGGENVPLEDLPDLEPAHSV